MIIPINCPYCNDHLLNTFNIHISKYDNLLKSCSKRINHTYSCLYDHNDDIIYVCFIIDWKRFTWDYKSKQLIVDNAFKNTDKKSIIIPWFDPDFSNKKVIINKLKTCLTFS